MRRFFSTLGKAVYSTFAFIAGTPRLARFFGILGNAVYWTAILFVSLCFERVHNGESLDFDVVHRASLLLFFLGFILGSYKGNSSFSRTAVNAKAHNEVAR